MTILNRVYGTILSRKNHAADQHTGKPSYVASLFAKGKKKIAQKVGEEAVEVVLASAEGNRQEIISETTDLLFHLMVLLAFHAITLEEVAEEFLRREGISGIEEKSQRKENIRAVPE